MTDWSGASDLASPQAESPRSRRREAWLAATLLLALVAVVHYDIIFQGRSLVVSNAWNPMDYRPLAQDYGDGFIPPEEWTRRNLSVYPNVRDPGATIWQWEPSLVFLRDAIRQGEWPFWNPYVAAGTPAMANMIPALFFPPSLIVVALGASAHVLNAYFLILLWGAAFLSFLFLRRHDLGFAASFTGSVIVLMSGALNQNLGSFMMQPVACLPLLLYTTRVFLDRPSLRRTALLAITYASCALASFPPLVIGAFMVTAVYAFTALALGACAGGRVRAASRWVAAVTLSMGLAGFYYGPAIALGADAPQLAEIYQSAGLLAMPFVHAFQLLSPTLMGGTQVYLAAPFAEGHVAPSIPYVGAGCVLLFCLSWPRTDRRNLALFIASAVTAAGILLKLFGVPPINWIAYLPILNQVHFAVYFGNPLAFPLAFLAALGVDAVTRGAVSIWRAAIAAALTLAAVAGLWLIANHEDLLSSRGAIYWIRDWIFVAFVTMIGATTLLVAVASGLQPRMRRLVVLVLLALVVAEGVYNNSYPSPRAWDTFKHPVPYITALQESGKRDRVLSFAAPTADVNEPFQIYSLDSLMMFNPPRVHKLFGRYGDAPPGVFMREAKRLAPDPVLDRSNIAVVSVRNAFPDLILAAQQRGYVSRFDDGFVTVFARPTLPRFFHSSEYRVVPEAAALEAIASAPSREIVLEEDPGFASTPGVPGDSSVQVDAYRRNSVILTVDAERPGLLYAAESFMTGWTARVNGEARRILPANYAFRAVAVPAGRSRVEFHYWPPGLTAGLTASVVSGLVVLALLAAPIVRRARGLSESPRTPLVT